MLTALVPTMNNEQTTISKSIVSNLEWFDGDRTKFED